MSRVLVVGANSFSGSHFVSRLLKEGFHVRGISRSDEPEAPFLPRMWEPSHGRYEFQKRDINDISDDFNFEVQEFNPRYIVNFASQGMVAESWKSPWDWYRTNTVGLSKLVAAASQIRALEKFVHVSTPEVYGDRDEKMLEGFDFSPTTPYAISRAAGDWHLLAMYRANKFPVVFTRAANVYGPGQQLYRLIPRAILSAELGESFPLQGNGSACRSFVHISDAVVATVRLMREGRPGSVYHLPGPKMYSTLSVVEKIANKYGLKTDDFIRPEPSRIGQDRAYDLDCSNSIATLGWRPVVDLDRGISDTQNWIKANLEDLATAPRKYQHRN